MFLLESIMFTSVAEVMLASPSLPESEPMWPLGILKFSGGR